MPKEMTDEERKDLIDSGREILKNATPGAADPSIDRIVERQKETVDVMRDWTGDSGGGSGGPSPKHIGDRIGEQEKK